MNERVTEEFTRTQLKENGDYINTCEQIVLPSRKRPEFLIYKNSYALVIECKAKIKDHDKAIKEVIEYMEEISKTHKTFALAVSGSSESNIITLIYKYRGKVYNKNINRIPSLDHLIKSVERANRTATTEEIKESAKKIKSLLNTYSDIDKKSTPILMSAICIGLLSDFNKSYINKKDRYLSKALIDAVNEVLEDEKTPGKARSVITREIGFIQNSILLNKVQLFDNEQTGLLKHIIRIAHNATGAIKENLSILFEEFRPKAVKDDIADLMINLIGVNKTDKIVDICAYTGDFLTKCHDIISKESITEDERENVYKNINGVELSSSAYAIAYTGLLLKGGALMKNASSFIPAKTYAAYGTPNKSFMNIPAISRRGSDINELSYIKEALSILSKGGKLCVIAPKTGFSDDNKTLEQSRRLILKEHTLECVISCKDTSVIAIFTANEPHSEYKKTFFYKLENDDMKKALIDIKNKENGMSLIIDDVDEWIYESNISTEKFTEEELINFINKQ